MAPLLAVWGTAVDDLAHAEGPTFPRWGEAEEAWKRLHRKLRG